MFYGEYDYKVDPKGRVAIPPEFRDAFRAGIIVRRGEEKCITIYPASVWEQMAQELVSKTPARGIIRKRNRYIFGFAFKLNADPQGRIVIPPSLREYANIHNIAVIVGANNCLELWNKEEWLQEREILTKEGPDYLEHTEEYNR